VISGNRHVCGGAFTAPGLSLRTTSQMGCSNCRVGRRVNDTVQALALQGNTLYVGGGFTSAGGSDAHYLARWDTAVNLVHGEFRRQRSVTVVYLRWLSPARKCTSRIFHARRLADGLPRLFRGLEH